MARADLSCRLCFPSGDQPFAVLDEPCGPPTPELLLDSTGTRDCIGVPDKSVSPGRCSEQSLIINKGLPFQLHTGHVMYLNDKTEALVLTFVTLIRNLLPPSISAF